MEKYIILDKNDEIDGIRHTTHMNKCAKEMIPCIVAIKHYKNYTIEIDHIIATDEIKRSIVFSNEIIFKAYDDLGLKYIPFNKYGKFTNISSSSLDYIAKSLYDLYLPYYKETI